MSPKTATMEILERLEKKVETLNTKIDNFIIMQTKINTEMELFKEEFENDKDTKKTKIMIPIFVGITCGAFGVILTRFIDFILK